MERTPYSSARNVSAIAAGRRAVDPDLAQMCAADLAAEAKAKRQVNTVATLRILVPVVVITAIVMSGRRAPEAPVDGTVAVAAATAPVVDAAPQYFPAQYLNQGLGGEEHVQNF